MRPIRLAAAALAAASLALPALAGNGAPDAGSLLVFPVFESGDPRTTLITVTNTNNNFTVIGPNLFVGSVNVHFIYVNGEPNAQNQFCEEFDRDRTLTPNDTLTVSSALHNPDFDRGYLYVYARNPQTFAAISWNYLIGASAHVGPDEYWELNPFVYRSGRGLADGAPTDFSPADGVRNLDGAEYERVVDLIHVPHFLGGHIPADGADPVPEVVNELVLINLSGAAQFTAIVNFLVYNDEEDQFSAQTTVRCWARRNLLAINGVFAQEFLAMTSSSSEEFQGLESGWYRMNGGGASSSADSLQNAAILAVHITNFEGRRSAQLPFTSGLNPNEGELLSTSIFHD